MYNVNYHCGWVGQRDRYAAGQRDRYAAGQRDRYAAGQRNRYAAGRRNRYAAVASQLSRYAASDYVSGTQIRGKFCRSGGHLLFAPSGRSGHACLEPWTPFAERGNKICEIS